MGQSSSLGQISCVSIGILSLFPLLALASPVLESDVEKREECGFAGDDNTYGLGIRIGIYLQWITSSIAYNFVPEEAVTMRGVNNCFQAAMFAGLLFITITKGPELYAVEAFIMLIFCMGGVCSGDNPEIGEAGKEKSKKYAYFDATTLGSLIRFSLGVGFCAYGVWFTFKGMDNMKHPPCSTFAFFIVRVNLYGWFRTFWKIMFTLGALMYAAIIIGGVPTLVMRYWQFLWAPVKQDFASQDMEDGNPKTVDTTSTSNLTLSTGLILFIIGVEMMVRWNHIEGVDSLGSTGQLLPLIIGVGGMFRVIHCLLKRLCAKLFIHRRPRDDDGSGLENSGSVIEPPNQPPSQLPPPVGCN